MSLQAALRHKYLYLGSDCILAAVRIFTDYVCDLHYMSAQKALRRVAAICYISYMLVDVVGT